MTWAGQRAGVRIGGPPRAERGDLARKAAVVGAVLAAAVVFFATLTVVAGPSSGHGPGGLSSFLGSAPAKKDSSSKKDKKDSDDSDSDSGDSDSGGSDSGDSDKGSGSGDQPSSPRGSGGLIMLRSCSSRLFVTQD